MMRAIDQDSGFRKDAEDLVENMLRLDSKNSYVLIYRMPKHYGRFASYSNAKEVLTSSVHKLLWDQIIVPWVALKEGADIIFNPKFSLPLLSPIPVTMGLQEFGFFTNPEYYTKWDVRYQKFMIPRCVRKSIHLFPNPNFILEENRRILGLPLQNTTVLYSASDNGFRPIEGGEELLKFKNRYNLPEKFIACLTRVDHPGLEGEDSFYGGKNPRDRASALLAAGLGVLAVFSTTAPFGVAIHRMTLTPERMAVFAMAAAGLLPFSLAFACLLRRGHPLGAFAFGLAGRALVVVLLGAGVATGVLPFVLVLMLPLLCVAFVLMELLAAFVYAGSRNLLAIALLDAGWLAAVSAAVMPVRI